MVSDVGFQIWILQHGAIPSEIRNPNPKSEVFYGR